MQNYKGGNSEVGHTRWDVGRKKTWAQLAFLTGSESKHPGESKCIPNAAQKSVTSVAVAAEQ